MTVRRHAPYSTSTNRSLTVAVLIASDRSLVLALLITSDRFFTVAALIADA